MLSPRSDPARWQYSADLSVSAAGILALHDLFDRIRDDHDAALVAADRLGLRTAFAELVANVVQHSGAGPDDEMFVGVNVSDSELSGVLVAPGVRVEVHATPVTVPVDAEDGRGMMLVQALCTVGYEYTDLTNVWHLARARTTADSPGDAAGFLLDGDALADLAEIGVDLDELPGDR